MRERRTLFSSKFSVFCIVVLFLVLVPASFLSARFAFAAVSPVTFDFDTGTPVLVVRQNTPLNQTSGGMTAYFTSVSGPNKFSVQNIFTNPNIQLSRFSGQYLYDNSPFSGDSIDIKFNSTLSSVNFTFATFEFHGPAGQAPSNITLTAYLDSNVSLVPWLNSTFLPPVGNMSVHGDWFSNDTYPQGTMLFNVTQPFNLVRIQLPYQGPEGAVGFALDNVIAVDFTAVPEFSPVVMLMLLVVNTVVLVVFARKRGFKFGAASSLRVTNK